MVSNLDNDPLLYEHPDGRPAKRVKVTDAVEGSFLPSGLTTGGRVTKMALTTSWLPLPSTPLADRNTLAIQNQSDNSGVIIVNYINTGSDGWRVYDGGYKEIPVTDSIIIYARMETGNGTILIDEIA